MCRKIAMLSVLVIFPSTDAFPESIGGMRAVYGLGDGCYVHSHGNDEGRTDSYTYVNATGYYGHEMFCEYGKINKLSPDSWRVIAKCASEGSEFTAEFTFRIRGKSLIVHSHDNKFSYNFLTLNQCPEALSVSVDRPKLGRVKHGSRSIEDSFSGVDRVREVQTHLYEIGFDVKVDGKMGPETATRIREAQQIAGLPVTGRITKELVDSLRRSEKPRIWGSIAYTADGAFVSGWNYSSRRSVEDVVRNRIRRRTPSKIAVSSVSGKQCAALASRSIRRGSFAVSGYGSGIDHAEEAALANCKRHFGIKCYIRTSICADGRHKP